MKGQQNLRMLIKILLVGWVSFLGFDASGQNCPQNNIVLTGFELRNENGNVFNSTDDFELGEVVTGELWVYFGGSSNNGYNMRFYFDIIINGVLVPNDRNNDGQQDRQYNCLFPGQAIAKNQWVKVRDFTWNWGDVVEISNIYAFWDTNNGASTCQELAADQKPPNSQCYNNPNTFRAAVPLFPQFDFTSSPICNTTVQFTNQTIGGTAPYNYTYTWDFTNDGSIDSNAEDPTYSFPNSGNHTVRLTVNDGTSTTTIYKEIYIDPNFDIQIDIFPTKADSDSGTGMIYVRNVTGGTAPYSYSWTGPNGFTSTDRDIFDLVSGTYNLVVTDVNGCTQRISYFLDVASVLKFEWNGVETISKGDEVKVTWVANSEIGGADYILERSIGNADNFIPVDSYLDVPDSDKPVRYELTDSTFPVFETKLYYRIIKRFGPLEYVSPVKLVVREAKAHFSWMAYPNPASGQPITLAYMGKELLRGEEVKMELFNSGNYYRQVVLSDFIQNKMVLQSLFGDVPKGILYLRVIRDKDVTMLKLINSY